MAHHIDHGVTVYNGLEVAADAAQHIVIGSEVMLYLKVFSVVMAGLFGVLMFVVGICGWFFRKVLKDYDERHNLHTNNARELYTLIRDTKADVGVINGRCETKSQTCPALHPEKLAYQVKTLVAVEMQSHQHRRATDPVETTEGKGEESA